MTRPTTLDPKVKAARSAAMTQLLEVAASVAPDALEPMPSAPIKVVRSGSVDVDMATGVGGWPRGRIVEIYGGESSGKTTVVLHAIVEAQRAGMAVIYIDAENSLVYKYMDKLGVDTSPDAFQRHRPEHLQGALNLVIPLLEAEAANPDGPGMVIVVDSIPALGAKVVMEESADKESMAQNARVWSTQLPRLALLCAKADALMFLINQERDSMATRPGQPTKTTPGGKAIRFFASIRVSMWRQMDKDKESKTGGVFSQKCHLDFIKNKVAPPFTKGVFDIVPGKPIDWTLEVISAGIVWDEVAEDQQWVVDKATGTGSLVKKRSYFTYVLREGELELARADERKTIARATAVARKAHQLAQKEEKAACEEVGADFVAREFVAKEVPTRLGDEVEAVTAYYRGAFGEKMRAYPSLVAAIESRLMRRLETDPDAVAADLYEDAVARVGKAEASAEDGDAAGFTASTRGTRKGAARSATGA